MGRGNRLGNRPNPHDQTPPGAVEAADTVPPPDIDQLLIRTFESVRDELVSTLAYILGNRDDALDVAQETFIKCWRAKHVLPDVQNLRAWIFRVGLNAARDHQRSGWTKRSKPLIGEDVLLPSRDESVGERMVEEENITRLREAICHLRPEEREVFLLRQNGEMTYEQIAEARNTPVGTVKTQMRTALMKLRKVLNPEADESPDSPTPDAD